MKPTFTLVLLTSAITVFTISSCKKDLLAPSVHTVTGYDAGTSPLILNLKADDWKSDEDEFYVNSFRNIIPARYYGRPIKFYLLTENREIQINHFISFMGGELWASVNGTDVAINYHCFGQRRFDYLNIKVLIE